MPRGERPLDAGDSALLRFARDLRLLRERAGSPTYRELSTQTHYSPAVLSQAAAGRRLPSLQVSLAYVRACGGAEAEWEDRWREVAAEMEPPEPVAGSDTSPYVGLAAFRTEDAERFFGREPLIGELMSRLAEHRVVVVVGASGSGKSSLLRAGLVPRSSSPVVLFTPGAHPLEECAIRLDRYAGTVTGPPTEDRRGLHRAVRRVMPDDTELLLVVDQFEEVFTLCHDPEERARFIEQLLTAAQSENSGCRVVLGVRADFYSHCTTHPELVDVLRAGQVTVGPMTADELRLAVVQPAVRAKCTVETALVTRIVAEASGQPGVLPLVSHALLETWRRRRGTTLTMAGYEHAGGIEHAVAHTAETVFTELTAERQRIAKQLFLRLCELGQSTEDTKRRVSRSELDTSDPNTRTILENLASTRLIVLDEDGVEIAHEALIRSWPRLRGWLAEDRDGLRIHRGITEATAGWLALHRDPGSLYRGIRLHAARDWAGPEAPLSPAERDFLAASNSAHTEEQAAIRRRARRLRQLVGVLTALLLVAAGTTVYAVDAGQAVTGQRNTALSQKVGAEAAKLRPGNPGLAAQLSLAAFRLAPTAEARSSLLSAAAGPVTTLLTGHRDIIQSVAVSTDGRLLATASSDHMVSVWDIGDPHQPVQLAVLTGHTDTVWSVAFHPSGTVLVTTSEDKTARLWDLTDPRHPGEIATLTAHDRPVIAAAFTSDGGLLATASGDHTVRLWDSTDPRNVREAGIITGHSGPVVRVAFGHGKRMLATSSWDGTVRLWDVADLRAPQELTRLGAHGDRPGSLVFSPDDTVLAAVGTDHTVHLWQVADPSRAEELAVFADEGKSVFAVTFSPDGRVLATTNLDRTVRLWEVATPRRPRELTVLSGHAGPVLTARFTPDGRTLATAGFDRVARLWDIPGPVLTGHDSAVYALTFSADGRVMATGSYDGTVRLWDVRDARRPRQLALVTGHTAAVNAVAFSPDGRVLVTGSLDHAVRLWDLADPERPGALAALTAHSESVQAVAFGPDGRTLVTGSADHSIRLWDVTDARQPRQLVVLTSETDVDNIESVAFSPDGRTLAAGTSGHVVRLWDLGDRSHPSELPPLKGHVDSVKSVAFSPDSRTIATGSADHTVRLWDVADPRHGEEIAILTSHTETVHAVAFSSAGDTLATASADVTARLWDVQNPGEPTETAILTGHAKRLYAVAFRPGGRILATGGEDRTTRLWEGDAERAADWVCANMRALTPGEWSEHFPGVEHQSPCEHSH
ncbi:helix-turn-helix domain-containing protein [Lentzea sp. NPDC059081]|uniref:nSTAND1 domain-containing NTPase n=1 Tax=Lentzea sp. NPDC059081 TaxID=3346719 RepID=UPI0036A2361F